MVFGNKQTSDSGQSTLAELEERRAGILAWVDAGAGCTADRDLIAQLDEQIAALKPSFNTAATGNQPTQEFGRRQPQTNTARQGHWLTRRLGL